MQIKINIIKGNKLNNLFFEKNIRKINFFCKQYLKYPIHKVDYTFVENYFIYNKKEMNKINKKYFR